MPEKCCDNCRFYCVYSLEDLKNCTDENQNCTDENQNCTDVDKPDLMCFNFHSPKFCEYPNCDYICEQHKFDHKELKKWILEKSERSLLATLDLTGTDYI